jgi:hypothetical protein
MCNWYCRPRLLSFTVLLGLVVSVGLVRCSTDGSSTPVVNGSVNLTATNAAALGGLTFTFPNATLFGFSGQSATLVLGDDGTIFILTTSGGTVINGIITFGSCTFTQTPAPPGGGNAPFTAVYDTCVVSGRSNGHIPFGGSGPGTITLILGSANQTPVFSDRTNVTYNIDTSGNITINTNTTPIGVIG